MNGSSFLFGVLAGVAVRRHLDDQVRAEVNRMDEDIVRRLENAANARDVSPVRPPLPVAQRVVAADASFQFGVPRGFAPLSPSALESWVAAAGPSLATLGDVQADAMPMLISAGDAGRLDPSEERAFWRLGCDLQQDVRLAASREQLSITDGPEAILVGGARAVWYAATGREGLTEVRSCSSLIINEGRAVEITMNVKPSFEGRYLPVWWTVLGTWDWF